MARHRVQIYLSLIVVSFLGCHYCQGSPAAVPSTIGSFPQPANVVHQDVSAMAASIEESTSHAVQQEEQEDLSMGGGDSSRFRLESEQARTSPTELQDEAVHYSDDGTLQNTSGAMDPTVADGAKQSREVCTDAEELSRKPPSRSEPEAEDHNTGQQDAAAISKDADHQNNFEHDGSGKSTAGSSAHHPDIIPKQSEGKEESSSRAFGYYFCTAIEKSTGNREQCTLSPEKLEAANKAIAAVSDTTKVIAAEKALLKHTPRMFDQSRQYLDQAAQHAVEKALEIAVIGGSALLSVVLPICNALDVATTVGMQVALATQKQIVSIVRSPQGQAVQIWAYKKAQSMIELAKEAVKVGVVYLVSVNRALWRIADSSAWLPSPSRRDYPMGSFFIYQDTNNIHALIPVFTKKHEYLGTFWDDSIKDQERGTNGGLVVAGGATKCADECWRMTAKAIEGCQGFEFVGNGLQDHRSRATCAICRSFVWYAMDHENVKLRGKCFAITTSTWAPAYETGVISGYFQTSDGGNSGSEENVGAKVKARNILQILEK
ncbi:hypothetical protein GUITHDRAFT_162589 [Guillardia theta CCMP2712]|uniref:Uncharacterized protein n=1 Tax=Guillardia theta (strain CCMP2712) TaxID=905079 RepID=L1JH35_GUITC|nr:hypothetical protein GUITHDRAFT_162589 [Guillardia theta CCMP2712]EKX47818.1 hypothetical protein GUITHDRAFT_162589 [Guillardia theta CCMP2712]|eukprot:XP_005834798.1 hypothetical protein GUITHDRAFT_162589 [Guillardia theta CCMP2712]